MIVHSLRTLILPKPALVSQNSAMSDELLDHHRIPRPAKSSPSCPWPVPPRSRPRSPPPARRSPPGPRSPAPNAPASCAAPPRSCAAKNDELAELETRDTGKPIQETRVVDVVSGAECLEYFAALAQSAAGEHIDLGPAAFGYTRREPLGVVAGIGAWNYPLQIACWKSAPALAFGNAMIFKPASLTPLTAIELEKVYREAGLPAGIFQVVQGHSETGRAADAPSRDPQGVADRLRRHRQGRDERCRVDPLKDVTLELGGKSPIIVFDDAKLDQAVSGALLGNFYSAGEVCSNGTRVFVHRKAKAEFLKSSPRASAP